jgi:hypothetical protein
MLSPPHLAKKPTYPFLVGRIHNVGIRFLLVIDDDDNNGQDTNT